MTDDGPVKTYLYDRQSRSARLLFVDRPELKNYTLAPMEPFRFTSRDGLTIHGYLTFPVGAQRDGLPTVLHVHGGPWSRDVWGFQPDVQWLANRGYLCVQVNFRGSTGYGKAFVNAGDKEWGGKMHNDLADAVRWVIEKGYADPKRVAIYGGSYGGYAAWSELTFDPRPVLLAAVDICGPSNLKTLIETAPLPTGWRWPSSSACGLVTLRPSRSWSGRVHRCQRWTTSRSRSLLARAPTTRGSTKRVRTDCGGHAGQGVTVRVHRLPR